MPSKHEQTQQPKRRLRNWFKIYDDMYVHPKIRCLSDCDFRVLVSLWCMANANSERGWVRKTISIGLTCAELAKIVRADAHEYDSAGDPADPAQEMCRTLVTLRDAGLLHLYVTTVTTGSRDVTNEPVTGSLNATDPVTIEVVNWTRDQARRHEYPSNSPEQSRERKRLERQRKREAEQQEESRQCHEDSHDCVTTKSRLSRQSHEYDTDTDTDTDTEKTEKKEPPPPPQGGRAASSPPSRGKKQLAGKKKKDSKPGTQVREVFAYWQETMGHPGTVLSPDRARKIQARLREGYTVDDCKEAIDGCKASAFHMGDNDQGRRYDSIGLIFRSAEKLDEFRAQAESGEKSSGSGRDIRSYDPAHEPATAENFGARFDAAVIRNRERVAKYKQELAEREARLKQERKQRGA